MNHSNSIQRHDCGNDTVLYLNLLEIYTWRGEYAISTMVAVILTALVERQPPRWSHEAVYATEREYVPMLMADRQLGEVYA